MHFYTWVIVIAILIVLGMVLRRSWEARQEEEGNLGTSSNASSDLAPDLASGEQIGFATQLTNSLRSRVQGLRNGFGHAEQMDSVTQFRNWTTSALTIDPEIQSWLAALTDEQITALTDHLTEFCRDMGFELDWLLDDQVEPSPELAQGLAKIVLSYSRASYQAVGLQEEVETFRIYHSYMQNPKSRVNRELGEHLFGKLVEQGMSTMTISEHLAASTQKRQQQIVETIHNTAVAHPKTFNTLLKTVLIERALPEIDVSATAINETAMNGIPKDGVGMNGATEHQVATAGSD